MAGTGGQRQAVYGQGARHEVSSPCQLEVFATVQDMIQSAIAQYGDRASLKQVYAACQKNGRIVCRKTGGWRLITDNTHWKSQIRHTLYTSGRFCRTQDDPDSWMLAPRQPTVHHATVPVSLRRSAPHPTRPDNPQYYIARPKRAARRGYDDDTELAELASHQDTMDSEVTHSNSGGQSGDWWETTEVDMRCRQAKRPSDEAALNLLKRLSKSKAWSTCCKHLLRLQLREAVYRPHPEDEEKVVLELPRSLLESAIGLSGIAGAVRPSPAVPVAVLDLGKKQAQAIAYHNERSRQALRTADLAARPQTGSEVLSLLAEALVSKNSDSQVRAPHPPTSILSIQHPTTLLHPHQHQQLLALNSLPSQLASHQPRPVVIANVAHALPAPVIQPAPAMVSLANLDPVTARQLGLHLLQQSGLGLPQHVSPTDQSEDDSEGGSMDRQRSGEEGGPIKKRWKEAAKAWAS